MSWSDLFYPDNPGRRDEVVKLSQKLSDLLTENFRATNDLIDVLNDDMGDAKFSKITFQPEKSIKENCELIRNRMREIQDLLDDKDRKLAESLEPRDKTNKMACAASEDSDQPGRLPSLIRVFAVRRKKGWVLTYPMSA